MVWLYIILAAIPVVGFLAKAAVGLFAYHEAKTTAAAIPLTTWILIAAGVLLALYFIYGRKQQIVVMGVLGGY